MLSVLCFPPPVQRHTSYSGISIVCGVRWSEWELQLTLIETNWGRNPAAPYPISVHPSMLFNTKPFKQQNSLKRWEKIKFGDTPDNSRSLRSLRGSIQYCCPATGPDAQLTTVSGLAVQSAVLDWAVR
ncbi:hypothetical protein QTP70_006468 [Hemibagrus guttatus]|uniref:Uncharacterized protein n=1 Tax=Hemibagrus guttatus TaxID=175788 RepID=A0AAE0R1F0_9TELE|nr:hypothetical protein QTP70_006468 [Hemibagrus guttatus]